MKKKALVAILAVLIGLLIYFLYGIFSFNLGDDFELLRSYKYKEKVNVNFYYIPSNATSRDYIQVRIKDIEHRKDTIINFEGYNYIVKSELDGALLNFIITDTSVHHITKVDTFLVNINDHLISCEK